MEKSAENSQRVQRLNWPERCIEYFFAAKSLFDWEMSTGAKMMSSEIRACVRRKWFDVVVDDFFL